MSDYNGYEHAENLIANKGVCDRVLKDCDKCFVVTDFGVNLVNCTFAAAREFAIEYLKNRINIESIWN